MLQKKQEQGINNLLSLDLDSCWRGFEWDLSIAQMSIFQVQFVYFSMLANTRMANSKESQTVWRKHLSAQ